MTLWTWQTWQDQAYLTCSLLPQPHGFFTSHFYPQTPEELISVISSGSSVSRVKQVHSADVLVPSEIEQIIEKGLPTLEDGTQASFPLADGVISEQAGQSVWACSADCTPALIADIKTGQVSAVHAGWRGTAQKILPAAVTRLLAQGSELENLRVALGPAIDGQVYQVEKEVAAKVGSTVVPTSSEQSSDSPGVAPDVATDQLVSQLMSMSRPPVLTDEHPERVRLDVRRINQLQLVQMGLDDQQIAIAPHCTYQEPDRFFSYRRTREKKVQWSGIVST